MGLELGPPWLTLVVKVGDEVRVLQREDFSTDGLLSITAARAQRAGSYVVVMDDCARFAHHADGRLYDPVEETVAHGTEAERARKALHTAKGMFRRMDEAPPSAAHGRSHGPFPVAAKLLICGVAGSAMLALLDAAVAGI